MRKKLVLSVVALSIAFVAIVIGHWAFGYYAPWSGISGSASTMEEQALSEVPDYIRIHFGATSVERISTKAFLKSDVESEPYSILDYLLGSKPNCHVLCIVDSSTLASILQEYYKEGTPARILIEDDEIVYEDAVASFDFNVKALTKYIASSFTNNDFVIDIQAEDYTSDSIKKANKKVHKKFKKLMWMNTWKVTYKGGVSIDKSYIFPYLNDDFDLDIDAIDFEPFFKELSPTVEESGKEIEFTTHAKKKIKVKYNTFGLHLYHDKEAEHLRQLLSDHKTERNRVPETYGYNKIGNDYIEVSIKDQHVWQYKDGNVVSETDCVTGDVTKDRGTPTGVFYISEMVPGKNLKGNNYTTWVNRWMRLTNQGVGLHDAYWRGSFGGDIYKGSGSHGCINLPKDYAYKLYDSVEKGTPVVVYNE